MPSQPPPRNNNQYGLEWLRIDDFSAGCYGAGNATQGVSPTLNPTTPYNTAPLGAAFIGGTYCCTSIAGGALAPLPRKTTDNNVSLIGGTPSNPALVAGLAITPQLANGGYEIVTILESDNGTNHFVKATSYQGGTLNTISGPTITSGTVAGFFGAPYPTFTRMTSSGSGNPPPVLVFPTAVTTDSSGASGHVWVYPELLSPTSFIAQDLIVSSSSTTGQIIAYGNRVIATAGLTYSWPSGSGIQTNENFNYTDPPESSTFGNQKSVLTIEAPWGYGAYGSVSVGELLLVKKYGGGVILNGDINTPTSVIREPAIQSTGDFVGQAAATPIGLVYCSQNQGAYVWNGGNTTQKISRNIPDNFFDLESGAIATNNYGFNVARWQKWILFSNNVLFDTETNAWWNLYPTANVGAPFTNGYPFWWYILTQNGYQMVTAPLQITAGQQIWTSVFDSSFPSPFYQWQSLPIRVAPNADRVIDVRQLVIRAGDPSNSGSATVTATIGSWSAVSTETIGIEPTTIRFNVGTGASGLQEIDLLLLCQNSTFSRNAAPTIFSIDIGYIVRAGVPVND